MKCELGRVVLVSRDSVFIERMTDLLSHNGYEAVLATSMEGAVRCVKGARVSACIVDIDTPPYLIPVYLIKEIKIIEGLRRDYHQRVIAVCETGHPQLHRECSRLGAAALLCKTSIDDRELLRLLPEGPD